MLSRKFKQTHRGANLAFYSEDQIQQMALAYGQIGPRQEQAFFEFTTAEFRSARATEFARHGYARRLKILLRCIERVYGDLPPERQTLPSRDELTDAAIHIQAFIFNIFGAIDNLAWIHAYEIGPIPLTKKKEIHYAKVGLGPKNKDMRALLSPKFSEFLDGLADWFELLENFRHALAHRIPLYIPPYAVPPASHAAYDNLEREMAAAAKRGDLAAFDRFSVAQAALGQFRPVIQHSFEENQKLPQFHAQMLADLETVIEMGRQMLDEIAYRQKPPT